MCGIVGYCGPKPASDILLEGLKRLEYRGYDSAGICVGKGEDFQIIKKKGKIKDLREAVPVNLAGTFGIGHTRWATHGEVNDVNSHPHTNDTGEVAVVHNGIIENYNTLKNKLISEGHKFQTDTDTEVIAHLIAKMYHGNLEQAVREALYLLKGTYGLAVMHKKEPGKIVGARNGSPLVLGVGDGEMFLASDVMAMMAHTKDAVYLEDGELVSMTKDSYTMFDLDARHIEKEVEKITWELEQLEKGGYRTFMEKEINEQSQSIKRAFQGRLDLDGATAHLGGLNMSAKQLLNVQRVEVVAAGTSYYAGMVGAYLLERLARIPAHAELSSEVRYKNPIVEPSTLYFVVSQSGETADTLYAMRELQRKGATVLGVCNAVGATIPRESDGGVYIHSGPEIAVASTKAFTSQISVFYLFALLIARMRHFSFEEGYGFIRELDRIPALVGQVLQRAEKVKEIALRYAHHQNFLFLGRGMLYPVALEGALKLKEISYIHAEGYSAAEIKHGPIALINEETPSVFLVPDDGLRDKVITSIKEVKARGGKVIAVAVDGDEEINDIVDEIIRVPKTIDLFYPFLMVVPLQLFAFYAAEELGRDVDQPRNLAKSVTVE
ncbi:MAG TPA: glutamine--fructose-6-phosphate transaminase (isomerizing) [Sediminispirochaeta sp.]|mgnify:CR=1 FL=1|nr:glutamine--fructose-6-phosphate transaminase (isomerizing) [Sediminispirochaeta sp.]